MLVAVYTVIHRYLLVQVPVLHCYSEICGGDVAVLHCYTVACPDVG